MYMLDRKLIHRIRELYASISLDDDKYICWKDLNQIYLNSVKLLVNTGSVAALQEEGTPHISFNE